MKIAESLSSLEWWFTTGFMGVMMSLAAAYMKSVLDRVISWISERHKITRAQRPIARRTRIAGLRETPLVSAALVGATVRNAAYMVSFTLALPLSAFVGLFVSRRLSVEPGPWNRPRDSINAPAVFG